MKIRTTMTARYQKAQMQGSGPHLRKLGGDAPNDAHRQFPTLLHRITEKVQKGRQQPCRAQCLHQKVSDEEKQMF
jgi:hypothetical protein